MEYISFADIFGVSDDYTSYVSVVSLRQSLTDCVLQSYSILPSSSPKKRRLSADESQEDCKKQCLMHQEMGGFKSLANLPHIFQLIFDAVLTDEKESVEDYLRVCTSWTQRLRSMGSYWNAITIPGPLLADYSFIDEEFSQRQFPNIETFVNNRVQYSGKDLFSLYPIPFQHHISNDERDLSRHRMLALGCGLGPNYCNAHRIKVLGISSGDLPHPLNVPFPNLQELHLQGGVAQCFFGDHVFKDFRRFFPQLHTLRIYNTQPDFWKCVPKNMLVGMRTLEVAEVGLKDAMFITKSAPDLKVLDMHLLAQLPGTFLAHAGLEELSLRMQQENNQMTIAVDIPNVKRLHVFNTRVALAMKRSSIRHLHSRGAGSVNVTLVFGCPELETADMEMHPRQREEYYKMLRIRGTSWAVRSLRSEFGFMPSDFVEMVFGEEERKWGHHTQGTRGIAA